MGEGKGGAERVVEEKRDRKKGGGSRSEEVWEEKGAVEKGSGWGGGKG